MLCCQSVYIFSTCMVVFFIRRIFWRLPFSLVGLLSCFSAECIISMPMKQSIMPTTTIPNITTAEKA